jgi:hypothetical protein
VSKPSVREINHTGSGRETSTPADRPASLVHRLSVGRIGPVRESESRCQPGRRRRPAATNTPATIRRRLSQVRGRPGKTPGTACCGRPSEGSADVPIRSSAKSRSAGFAPEVVEDPVLLDRLVSCHGSVLRAFFDRQRGDRVGVVRPIVRVTPSLPERPGAKPFGLASGVRRRSRPCPGRRLGPMMPPSKRSEGSWPCDEVRVRSGWSRSESRWGQT